MLFLILARRLEATATVPAELRQKNARTNTMAGCEEKYREQGSNLHVHRTLDPKSSASTNSAISAFFDAENLASFSQIATTFFRRIALVSQ